MVTVPEMKCGNARGSFCIEVTVPEMNGEMGNGNLLVFHFA